MCFSLRLSVAFSKVAHVLEDIPSSDTALSLITLLSPSVVRQDTALTGLSSSIRYVHLCAPQDRPWLVRSQLRDLSWLNIMVHSKLAMTMGFADLAMTSRAESELYSHEGQLPCK